MKRGKSTGFLIKHRDTIKELCEKHEIEQEVLEDIIDNFFADFKKFITDPRMPKIQITNFGTFKVSVGKINWFLKVSFFHFKIGNIDRENIIKRIKRVWPVKQRLIKEDNGKETWKEWKNKKFE